MADTNRIVLAAREYVNALMDSIDENGDIVAERHSPERMRYESAIVDLCAAVWAEKERETP